MYYQSINGGAQKEILSDVNYNHRLSKNGRSTGILWQNSSGHYNYTQFDGSNISKETKVFKGIPQGDYYLPDSIVHDDSKMVCVKSGYNVDYTVWTLTHETGEHNNFVIKPIKNIKCHYPFIFMVYGANELWVININIPKIIKRVFMEGTILAVENADPSFVSPDENDDQYWTYYG
jgi:hypothetical protein